MEPTARLREGFGEDVEEVAHVGLCWLVSMLIDLGA